MMKKIKLPRKRKKLFKKECSQDPNINYMAARIINEMCIADPENSNPKINYRKFYRKLETYPNGATKRVISYY